MLKISVVLSVAFINTVLLFIVTGCTSTNIETSVDTKPGSRSSVDTYVTGNIVKKGSMPFWRIVDIDNVNSQFGQLLPLPTYLPDGYEIQETYESTAPRPPWWVSLMILISDKPIEWTDDHYRCRLVLYVGWNREFAVKPNGETIASLPDGVLAEQDGEYILWYKNFNCRSPAYEYSYNSDNNTLRLIASSEFPKDELIKIAASTYTVTTPSP